MSTITALGVGSGLDIADIVRQLVAAERSPVQTRLDSQEKTLEAKLSAFGTLKSALAQFQTGLGELSEVGAFLARTASSGSEEVFTASAGTSAAPGTFDLVVQQVAQSHSLVSKGYESASAAVGSGTLTISVGGNAFSVAVDATHGTLAGIRDAITGASDNTGVAASIVRVDGASGGTVAKLVLTSTVTGTEGSLTVAVDDADGVDGDTSGLSALAYLPSDTSPAITNLTELRAAQDAKLTLDGQAVTSSSNTVDDAIEGVTLTLQGVSGKDASGAWKSSRLAIAIDPSAAAERVQGFVTAYNAVLDAIRSVASYDASSREATALFGDSAVRGLQSRLRAELSRVVSDLPAGAASLAEIGVRTGRDGKLELDQDRLHGALNSNLDAVAKLFAGEGGCAQRLDDLVSSYLDADGLIESRTEGLNGRLEAIEARREALDRRMESLEARLLKQYTAMDTLVAQLQTTSSYLTQQLELLKTQTSQ